MCLEDELPLCDLQFQLFQKEFIRRSQSAARQPGNRAVCMPAEAIELTQVVTFDPMDRDTGRPWVQLDRPRSPARYFYLNGLFQQIPSREYES